MHRDVKPANILVSTIEGRAARVPHRLRAEPRHGDPRGITESGVLMGTPEYMAPEQYEDRRLDPRADVYALGCVLFQSVTGRAPYRRDSAAALMWAHLSEPPPSPRSVPRPCRPGSTPSSRAPWPSGPRTATRPPAIQPPVPLPVPRSRRSPWLTLGLPAAALVLVAAVIAVLTLVPSGAVGTIAGAPVPVGRKPLDVEVGGGFVWTANADDGTVSKIDPATMTSETIASAARPPARRRPDAVWSRPLTR